ncbi:hypothetical protein ACFQAT_25015 [Undibacterium arcticum]
MIAELALTFGVMVMVRIIANGAGISRRGDGVVKVLLFAGPR